MAWDTPIWFYFIPDIMFFISAWQFRFICTKIRFAIFPPTETNLEYGHVIATWPCYETRFGKTFGANGETFGAPGAPDGAPGESYGALGPLGASGNMLQGHLKATELPTYEL